MKHLLSTVLATSLALTSSFVTSTVHAQEEEINVLMFGMPFTNGLRELADDFEAETGIKANIDVVGQDVFESRISLSFTGGTGDIDVVHTPVIQVQRWIQAGWLQPITDMVSEETTSDILAGPLGAYNVDGKQWALPFFAGVGLMSYREDLLESAGAEVPQTWEEMLSVAEKITTDDQAAIALRAVPGQGFNMFIFPMVMRAYGGTFFADYEGGDLTPAINSPQNIEALNIYTSLINDYGPEGAGNFNFAEVNAAAKNGQIAFAVEGTGIISQIVDPANSKYADVTGIALPPGGPAGRSPAIGVHGMGIPASAANADAAAKFIEWAVSAETVTKIAMAQSFPDFTTASVANNPEVVAKYASIHPDFLTTRVAALELAIGHYRPLIPEWPALGQAIGESVNAAINGLMSSEDALEQAEADMRDILGL